jgi:hypothetical protein
MKVKVITSSASQYVSNADPEFISKASIEVNETSERTNLTTIESGLTTA